MSYKILLLLTMVVQLQAIVITNESADLMLVKVDKWTNCIEIVGLFILKPGEFVDDSNVERYSIRYLPIPTDIDKIDLCDLLGLFSDQLDPERLYSDVDLIKNKLSKMVQADQSIRVQVDLSSSDDSIRKKMVKVDQENTEALKRLLVVYGWITISKFGKQADHEAWMLVQHADHDIPFQKKILSNLEDLYQQDETNPTHYAYLYDRVAMHEGRPQRYGTQMNVVNGELVLHDIEEKEQVDTHRSSVGLPSLEQYMELVNQYMK